MAEGEAELMKELQKWPPADVSGLFFYVIGQMSETPGWVYFRRAVQNGIDDYGTPGEKCIVCPEG